MCHGKNDIIICAEAKPAWFDAHNQIAGAARIFADNVVPGLLAMGNDAAPVPRLAKRWRFEEPKIAVIELEEGRCFSNLRRVDAAIVCKNLDRARNSRPRNVYNAREFQNIERVEASGKHRVTVRMRNPFAPLFGLLANGFGIVDLAAGEPPENVTGAGPFKIAGTPECSIFLDRVDRDRSLGGVAIL